MKSEAPIPCGSNSSGEDLLCDASSEYCDTYESTCQPCTTICLPNGNGEFNLSQCIKNCKGFIKQMLMSSSSSSSTSPSTSGDLKTLKVLVTVLISLAVVILCLILVLVILKITDVIKRRLDPEGGFKIDGTKDDLPMKRMEYTSSCYSSSYRNNNGVSRTCYAPSKSASSNGIRTATTGISSSERGGETVNNGGTLWRMPSEDRAPSGAPVWPMDSSNNVVDAAYDNPVMRRSMSPVTTSFIPQTVATATYADRIGNGNMSSPSSGGGGNPTPPTPRTTEARPYTISHSKVV